MNAYSASPNINHTTRPDHLWRSSAEACLTAKQGVQTAQGNLTWLTASGSMTAHLQALSAQPMQVTVLAESFAPALPGEPAFLAQTDTADHLFWTRKVLLAIDKQPCMTARTLCSAASLEGEGKALQTLGTTPLGQLLFQDPNLTRTAWQYAQLPPEHPDAQMTHAAVDTPLPPALWARRSCFTWQGRRLLVNEIFLPHLLNQPSPMLR